MFIGEPSSPVSNGMHCKYEDLFWNGKRKSGNFLSFRSLYNLKELFAKLNKLVTCCISLLKSIFTFK